MKIKNKEIKREISDAIKKYEDNYKYFGVRFEKKDRVIGEVCANSKGNFDRIDEREFPDYDSPEYDMMPDLGGTSAYDAERYEDYILDTSSEITEFDGDRLYVIASNDYFEGEDRDEFIMPDAVVVGVIV
jgi:hypothetical protein